MAANPQDLALPPIEANDLDALRSAVQNFDREQLIWSSGYLAGLAVSPVAKPSVGLVPAPAPNDGAADAWHVYFATETGNSRRIAEQVVANGNAAGLSFSLHDLATTRPKALRGIRNAVFVLATHGIGEPPEGSEAFFDFWLSARAPRLTDLRYSILALGDSSYADFCEMGGRFDARLRELGATAIVDRIDCDLDFDTPAADWSRQVIDLAATMDETTASPRPAQLSAVSTSSGFDRARPFPAEIVNRQLITGRGSSKQVQHLELDLQDSGLVYEPGDSLGIWPANPPRVIEAAARATGLDAEVLQDREITALSRPILEAVAARHTELRSIIADRAGLADYLATRQLVDLVHEFPVDWRDPDYLAILRTLGPRSYSIASSPDANPDEAHLTVAVVAYEAHGRHHWGAASNYLTADADNVPVFVERNAGFRLPPDPATPIIMIGAGTGVAPYRAFVEHRREHAHGGDNWLIFGDRNLSSDFLYQLEWLRYRREKWLARLDVAFSRDQSEKIYVQDRVLENGRQLYAWLENGAHVYVCGDAARMAVDVDAALAAVVAEHGNLTAEGACEYLGELRRARRYQRDVY